MPAGEVFVDIYADHGCSYAPSCLNCPFDVCRYDRGFAGNRVPKAMTRLDRDKQVSAMRARGMQVEQIASACGISGRTVARILSRSGPSKSDRTIVQQYDVEAEIAASKRKNDRRSALQAMGVKLRTPFPPLKPANVSTPRRQIYSTGASAESDRSDSLEPRLSTSAFRPSTNLSNEG